MKIKSITPEPAPLDIQIVLTLKEFEELREDLANQLAPRPVVFKFYESLTQFDIDGRAR